MGHAQALMPGWDYRMGLTFDRGRGVGVANGTPYHSEPMTSYQRVARRTSTGVRDHATQIPLPRTLDLYASNPCPADRRIYNAPPAWEGGGRRSRLRCDAYKHVATLMTSPWPGGVATGVIHWNVSLKPSI